MVLVAFVIGCPLWLLAQMRLCLPGIEESAIQSFLVRRTYWIVACLGLVAFCVVLAGELAPGQTGALRPGSLESQRHDVAVGLYVAAAILALVAVVIWRYSASMVKRARADRGLTPDVCRGTVRWLIPARAGGWPVLVRRDDGRWRWLIGSQAVLAPVRARLARAAAGTPVRLTVTLVNYRRSRIIKQINGMFVEALSTAWQPSEDAEPQRV
jgi:hypothetical protein